MPRRGVELLREQVGAPENDLDFKARAALLITAQLGYVAFERLAMLFAEIDDSDREAVRERVKRQLDRWLEDGLATGAGR